MSMVRRVAAVVTAAACSGAGLALVSAPITSSIAKGAGTPTFAVGDAAVHEGDTGGKRSLSFTLSLSEPAASTVTVDYSLVPVTATPGADFQTLKGASKTLTFKSGRVQKSINVPVVPDTSVEGDETLHVMLQNATGGAVIGDDQGVGTIIDDDPGSGLRLGVGDASVYEGDAKVRTAKLWVTLSDKAPAPVSVQAVVSGDTATAGSDFKAVTKNLTFKTGQFKKVVNVTVKSDLTDESDETFHVMLQSASGAAIADAMGSGTIVDDDVVTRPWYCDPTDTAINDSHPGDATFNAVYTQEKGPLSAQDCAALQQDLDASLDFASQYPTVSSLPSAWKQAAVWAPGQGVHYVDTTRVTGPFDPTKPNWLMYDGTSPDSKLTGMMFLESQPGGANSVPPAGFPGDNDHWHRHGELCYKPGSFPFIVGEHLTDEQCTALGGTNQLFSDVWMVHVWLPIYDNWVATDIFNMMHPSLM
jgi:Calx-beta domain